MSLTVQGGKPIHTGKIFWASFLTLISAGVGFAIRGGILGDWGSQFGFTKSELGAITGGGLTGFGITIIACSLIADRVGYRVLLLGAFLLHSSSAVVTLCATPLYESMYPEGKRAKSEVVSAGAAQSATPAADAADRQQKAQKAVYWLLYIGMFMFALGNGLAESAINPLVATLYPKAKTHYLNILHAGWPGGLILGSLFAHFFTGAEAASTRLQWEIPMAVFLLPTLWYGFIVFKERFPVSEASVAGINLGTMILQVLSPLLLFLFLIHAMVGYVELGTDSWITDIMKSVVPGKALILFMYTSGLMFVLRFFAGPIVHRINPLGLLFVSACLATLGLYLLGSTTTGTTTTVAMIVLAATIYGLGKTFFWPTMLGVVGERFPKAGALAMGLSGGIGMLSAGLLGGPGIGYFQDKFATEKLRETAPEVYSQFAKSGKNEFPLVGGIEFFARFFPPTSGLDPAKVSQVLEAKPDSLTPEQEKVKAAAIHGGQSALIATAAVPATMAVCYLLLVLYFAARGGYKQIHLEASGKEVEEEAD
jgi:MFS family permease